MDGVNLIRLVGTGVTSYVVTGAILMAMTRLVSVLEAVHDRFVIILWFGPILGLLTGLL